MGDRLAERVVDFTEILVAHLGRDGTQTPCLHVLLEGGYKEERFFWQHRLYLVVDDITPSLGELLCLRERIEWFEEMHGFYSIGSFQNSNTYRAKAKIKKRNSTILRQ